LLEVGLICPMRPGPERALSRGEADKGGEKVMTAPVKVQRLHANEAGLSHFDTFEIEREMTSFAPPAQPFPVSKPTPASRFVLLQLPAGWSGERHRTPARQVLFCLAGSVRVTPGVGDATTISAGDSWLMEDTTGSGHTTEVISQEPFEAVVIQLSDDMPLAGH
jgi:quercetin dioxygenase-like cupin family protein